MALVGSLLVLAVTICSILAQAPFGDRQNLGVVYSYLTGISQASGLAASRVHEDVVWVHNDKSAADNLKIFAIDVNTGNKVADFTLNNATNSDWEDLAIGPCVDDCQVKNCSASITPSRYCIYVADIGGPTSNPSNTVYMVREPTSLASSGTVDVAAKFQFSWTERHGKTVMVSPAGEVFIVSDIRGQRAKMVELPGAAWDIGLKVHLDMSKAISLQFTTTHTDPQGGDISPAGDEMIFVCEELVYYYDLGNMDYLSTASTMSPSKVSTYKYVPHTDAIAWKADGQGFYTLAEGYDQTITFYPKNAAPIG